MSDYILEMNHVTKYYPGVVALDDVSIKVERGSVHAIVGENGAGKSTLIKTLAGAIKPDGGEIILEGEKFTGMNPQLAKEKGVGVVYQEFNLIPQLTVTENIFFKREIKKGIVVDTAKMNQLAAEKINELGLDINVKAKTADLSVAYQQLVEITKIVSQDAKVIVMDEPSAPLTNKELGHLYELIKRLKAKGVTIIYISHRLEEIFEICDTVSIMRDGKHVKTMPVAQTNQDELIANMVGHEMKVDYPQHKNDIGEVVLETKNLYNAKLRDVSIRLHKGEILGFAGLVGAGRTELARAIFGADPIVSGEVYYKGEKMNFSGPKDAIRKGFGLVPENRKEQGVLLHLSVQENIVFANYDEYSRNYVLNTRNIKDDVARQIGDLRIKTPSDQQLVQNLSGGNQQKVVVAKWLATHSDVIIFDEPTRGIDVGAKQEIYSLMSQLAESGKSIIMISSEMPELIGMADRMIVMCEGAVAGELKKEEFEQTKILALASGM